MLAKFKYHRELRFWPLLNLYINLAFGVTKWKQKREEEIEENGKSGGRVWGVNL